MTYGFISGKLPRSRKRIPSWPNLPEVKAKTFCGKPSFYANCEMFKVKQDSPQ